LTGVNAVASWAGMLKMNGGNLCKSPALAGGSSHRTRKGHSMKLPLQITIRDFPQSEALEARIREKAAKLEEFHPRITSCRVTVEEMRKHHQQGRHFQVNLDVRVPGKEIVVNHAHDEDVYVALRDAFDAANRQLEETAHVEQGNVKGHARMVE
jgi:ribosomal subunit interface protein